MSSSVSKVGGISFGSHALTYPDTTGMTIQNYAVDVRLRGFGGAGDSYWHMQVKVQGTQAGSGGGVPEPSCLALLLGCVPMLWGRRDNWPRAIKKAGRSNAPRP